MTAKEALAIIEYYSTVNEMKQDKMQQDFDSALSFIKQALEELEKKDELLELYRELHETQDMVTYENVLEQIKALEEALK